MQKPVLPFDEQVEKAVLGAILQRNDNLIELASSLKESDFYIPKHKYIYRAMLEYLEQSKSIDEVTIAHNLDQKNLLAECGGLLYLTELLDASPAPENIGYYSSILKEHSISREVIRISSEISNNIKAPNQSIEAVLSQAQKRLDELAHQRIEKLYYPLGEVLQTSELDIKQIIEQKKELTGLSSGFRFLDKITSGLQNSDLIVIAARPSVGKTALSLDIAYNVAVREKKGVAFFSLEMSKEQIAKRIISSSATINNNRLRTGNLERVDYQKITKTVAELKNIPFCICDQPGITSFEVQTLSNQINRDLKGNLGLIVVDYLQLMGSVGKYNNRQEAIAEISRSLKLIAKKFNVPVIANAQLNRDLAKRKEKRPVLSDLRDSGTIEQDADIVMFIYRDVMHDVHTKHKDDAEILVSKFRNGETGKHYLRFMGGYTQFVDLSEEEEQQRKMEDLEDVSPI